MDPSRLEAYYGAWMLSSCDVDRQVSQIAQATWSMALQAFGIPKDSQGPGENEEHLRAEFVQRLESFVLHAAMHPQSLYAEFYPVSATGSKEHTRDSLENVRGGEPEEERAGDRDGRIRTSALAAIKALIGSHVPSHLTLMSIRLMIPHR